MELFRRVGKGQAGVVLVAQVDQFPALRALSAIMSRIERTAGTSTSDPVLLIGVPLLLAALALVSCYVPARKTAEIDPV